jgi:hypothetical protein
MPLVKPASQPGFNSQASQVQAAGAWFAGNRVRWRFGLLEKMGGWIRLYADPFFARIRRMHAWADLEDYRNLLVGTDLGLEILVQNTKYTLGHQLNLLGGIIVEIGPTPSTTTFNATSGSKTVTVNTKVGIPIGERFYTLLPLSIGGRIIPANSYFTVTNTLAGSWFTFDMPQAATYTETGTYGTRLFKNTVVNGITCTWKAHGLVAGSTITFNQQTVLEAGSASLNYEVVEFYPAPGSTATVNAVIDADNFTFPMPAPFTGNGSGREVYDGCQVQDNTGGPFNSSLANMIGIPVLEALGNPQQDTWFLDNLGETGLALRTGGALEAFIPPIENGPWTVAVGGGAIPATAPQHSNGMFTTMPQAQVVLFGSEPIMGNGDIDPLLVRWSDAGTYDVYTATVSNQAGSYRLSRGSKIVAGIQAPQTTLLITDMDLWSMSYIGPPLIYGFTVMGTGCGAIAPHAIVTLGKTTYWLSLRNVWSFGDQGVQMMPCSVWDTIFENLDPINIKKCHGAANSTTGEIAFYFVAKSEALDQPNLLADSQNFAGPAWTPLGLGAFLLVNFNTSYVYEPKYVALGWFDDNGLATISWLDRDVQAAPSSTVMAPDGTFTATTLLEDNSNGVHLVQQEVLKFGEPQIFTLSIYAYKGSTRNITLEARSSSSNAFVTFNVTNGTEVANGAAGGFKVISWGETADDFAGGITVDGWLRYFMVFETDDSESMTVSINLTNGTQVSYAGSGQFANVWGAQLNLGGALLEYTVTGDLIPQNETVHYIKYNTIENAWDSGALDRSAWIDTSIWGTPLGADGNNLVQQHERGFDDDGNPMEDVFVESGFTELSDGSQMLSVHQCHPDFKWFGNNGEVKVSLKMRSYPEGPEQHFGPFSMTPTTQFFNPRARGRYVAMRYDWSPLFGFSARVGATTYLVKPAGRRP